MQLGFRIDHPLDYQVDSVAEPKPTFLGGGGAFQVKLVWSLDEREGSEVLPSAVVAWAAAAAAG